MISKLKFYIFTLIILFIFSCSSDEVTEVNTSMSKSSNVAPGLMQGEKDYSKPAENIFRINFSDPPTFDPHLVTDTTSASIIVEIFSGLVTLNKKLEIVPDLAESWNDLRVNHEIKLLNQ